eukprot:5812329-Prymnesium_polylepis.1
MQALQSWHHLIDMSRDPCPGPGSQLPPGRNLSECVEIPWGMCGWAKKDAAAAVPLSSSNDLVDLGCCGG